MQYGLDMAFPPTPEQAAYMRQLGYTFSGVYIGGPRALSHDAWQQRDGERYPVRDIASAFDGGFLPIYVGRNEPWDSRSHFTSYQGKLDAADANTSTGACGFDSGSPLCLDLEYGTYQKHPMETTNYVRAFANVVRAAGHVFGIYSDPGTIEGLRQHMPQLLDFVWGASWVRGWTDLDTPNAPVGMFDPLDPPPWDAWQFGGGVIKGVSVDLDSATDAFTFARYAL
jgi:hypothetical protein